MQQTAHQEIEFSVPLLHTCARNVCKRIKCHHLHYNRGFVVIFLTSSHYNIIKATFNYSPLPQQKFASQYKQVMVTDKGLTGSAPI